MDTKDESSQPKIVTIHVQSVSDSKKFGAVNRRVEVPEDLLNPMLNLMSSLCVLYDAEAAMAEMLDEVRKHHMATRSQLTLDDFVAAAERVEVGEVTAVSTLMALTRFAQHNPEELTVTCNNLDCSSHVSRRCKHITSASAATKDKLAVDTLSLHELTMTDAYLDIRNFGDKGRNIVQSIFDNI